MIYKTKKVFAADPRVCPDCCGPMRIVAFVEEPRVVRAIVAVLQGLKVRFSRELN